MEAKIDNLVSLIEGMSVRLTAVEERTMLGTFNTEPTHRPRSYADAVRSHNPPTRHHTYNTHHHTDNTHPHNPPTRHPTYNTRHHTYNTRTHIHNTNNTMHTNTQSRGPRQFTNSTRYGDRGHHYNSMRPIPPSNTRTRSNITPNNNIPDMDLAHLLYKVVQLRSHELAWQSCPVKASEQVKGFINSITPPLPALKFIQELQALETHINDRAKTIVQDHLRSVLTEVRQALADSDSDKLEEALSVAKLRLSRFQRKLPVALRDQWLREEALLVGTQVHVMDKDEPRPRTPERIAPATREPSAPSTTSGIRPRSPPRASTSGITRPLIPGTPLGSVKRPIDLVQDSPTNNGINNNNTNIKTSNKFEVLNSLSVVESPRKQRITRHNLTQNFNYTNNNHNSDNINKSFSQPVMHFSDESSDAEPSLNDMIQEIIASSNPGSPSEVTTPSGYIKVHDTGSTSAELWELKVQSQAPVVIVADSNMRWVDNIPQNLELHVFPGCKLQHVDRMMRTAVLRPETQHILVAVGINNRSDAADKIQEKLATVIDVIKRLNRNCHFLGISYNGLPDLQADNIDLLNSLAKSKLQDCFIEPLQREQVVTKHLNDIHHNNNTVSKILSTIIEHFLL